MSLDKPLAARPRPPAQYQPPKASRTFASRNWCVPFMSRLRAWQRQQLLPRLLNTAPPCLRGCRRAAQLGYDKQRLAEEAANPVLLVGEGDRPGTAPTK